MSRLLKSADSFEKLFKTEIFLLWSWVVRINHHFEFSLVKQTHVSHPLNYSTQNRPIYDYPFIHADVMFALALHCANIKILPVPCHCLVSRLIFQFFECYVNIFNKFLSHFNSTDDQFCFSKKFYLVKNFGAILFHLPLPFWLLFFITFCNWKIKRSASSNSDLNAAISDQTLKGKVSSKKIFIPRTFLFHLHHLKMIFFPTNTLSERSNLYQHLTFQRTAEKSFREQL